MTGLASRFEGPLDGIQVDVCRPEAVEAAATRTIEVFGKIDEITALICWIANEECSFTTGAVFDASEGRATY